MKIADISLVEVDKFCDYIPFVSTVTNLVDLFIKTICSLVENYKGRDPTIGHHYFSYLQNEKKAWRSTVLLIPIFGNLYIFTHPTERRDMELERVTLVTAAKALYVLFLSVRSEDPENRLPTILEKESFFNEMLGQYVEAGGEIFDELSDYLVAILKLSQNLIFPSSQSESPYAVKIAPSS